MRQATNPSKQRHRIQSCTFIILIVSTALLLASCVGDSDRTVKIALSIPATHEVMGPHFRNSAELALSEANYRAGNVDVELLVLDNSDANTPYSVDKEIEMAQAAVADPDVVAYIGPPTSGQAKQSIPILNRASITQIGIAATWAGLTQPGYGPSEPGIYYPTGQRTFFRIFSTTDSRVLAGAEHAIHEHNMQTTYIVDDGTAYGSGIAGIWELAMQDLGIGVVGKETIDLAPDTASAAEIDALAERIAHANPDVAYLGVTLSLGQGTDLLVAIREKNPNIMIMGTEGLIDLVSIAASQEIDPALIEGTIMVVGTVAPTQIDTDQARNYLANYEATYGQTVSHPFAMTVYEATKVLLYAIEHAEQPTREGVLEAMHNLDVFSGCFGDWSFTPEGDLDYTMAQISEMKNGQWEVTEVILGD